MTIEIKQIDIPPIEAYRELSDEEIILTGVDLLYQELVKDKVSLPIEMDIDEYRSFYEGC